MDVHDMLCSVSWIILATFQCAAITTTNGYRKELIPRFYRTSTNVTYNRGELAVLYCSIENLGTKTVIWRKHPYNVPITVGLEQFLEIERFYLNHDPNRDQWNLLIKNAQTHDSGVYECQVSTKTTILRRNITLNIIEKERNKQEKETGIFNMRRAIDINGTRFVEKGTMIILRCNATTTSGRPEKIAWYFKGNVISTTNRNDITIQTRASMSDNSVVSTMYIRNASLKDSGTYVCRTSELLTTRYKVDVLNAETYNKKRVAITGGDFKLPSRTRSKGLLQTPSILLIFAGFLVILLEQQT